MHRVTIEASASINAPVERVWAEVANFNNVANRHPDVIESRLLDGATGAQAGDVRAIRLRDGTLLRERLVESDPGAHCYTYSVLDGQLPLVGHISTVTMRQVDATHTEVSWSASFEPAGAPAEGLAQEIRRSVLETGLRGLTAQVGDPG